MTLKDVVSWLVAGFRLLISISKKSTTTGSKWSLRVELGGWYLVMSSPVSPIALSLSRQPTPIQ